MYINNQEKEEIIKEEIAEIERTIRYAISPSQEEIDARKETNTEELLSIFIQDQQSKILALQNLLLDLNTNYDIIE